MRNKGAARIRIGLSPALVEEAAGEWDVELAVPHGTQLEVGRPVHVLPDRSDLVLEEVTLPRLMARYDVVYTQREALRLGRRRPGLVLQLHEHQNTRYAPWLTPRDAARGALRAYRTSTMYREVDHLCFSSAWTRGDFIRLERREPASWSVVPLAGWPDGDDLCPYRDAREPVGVVVASGDVRDDLSWAQAVWQRANLPEPWQLLVAGRVAFAMAGTRMRALGWLSDPDLSALLRRSRFYLHVGRTEGFGLSVVEALQAGTPVVARRGSAVDELLARGGGYLVESIDDAATAVRRLVAGEVTVSAAVNAGARYRWSRTAAAVLSGCRAVLAARRVQC